MSGPRGLWTIVAGDAELAEWERVWRASGSEHELVGYPRVFPAALLRRPVHFLAGRSGSELVAIATLIRGGAVVGVTNAIAPSGTEPALFSACLDLARTLHPGVEVEVELPM